MSLRLVQRLGLSLCLGLTLGLCLGLGLGLIQDMNLGILHIEICLYAIQHQEKNPLNKEMTKKELNAINILFPKHRMIGQWHQLYKNTETYCTDDSPNGWGNFGCERCNTIRKLTRKDK